MNIFRILIKVIRQNIRDKKSMAMMILFPILLILVLGNALKNTNGYMNTSIEKSKILYYIQNTGIAAKDFKENIIDKGSELNIDFVETNDIEAAKKQIKDINKYNSFILMKDDDTIEIYKNSKFNTLSGLSESVINSYVQRYNTIVKIAKENPLKLREILSDTNTHYTNIVSLNKARTSSSIDYYTITMITLIIMYGVSYSLFGISGEMINKTGNRILSAPVKKYEFLIGNILGFVLLIIFQISIVILFTKYVLNSYWGNNMIPVVLVIISQIIMVISLGMGFGFTFKNSNTANGIINVLIPIFEFLGGGYFSVDGLSSEFFRILKGLSPVAWTNKAIFSVIYGNDISKVLPAIAVNISIAAVCIAVSSIKFRRELA